MYFKEEVFSFLIFIIVFCVRSFNLRFLLFVHIVNDIFGIAVDRNPIIYIFIDLFQGGYQFQTAVGVEVK